LLLTREFGSFRRPRRVPRNGTLDIIAGGGARLDSVYGRASPESASDFAGSARLVSMRGASERELSRRGPRDGPGRRVARGFGSSGSVKPFCFSVIIAVAA
jgi:hypothetical protein